MRLANKDRLPRVPVAPLPATPLDATVDPFADDSGMTAGTPEEMAAPAVIPTEPAIEPATEPAADPAAAPETPAADPFGGDAPATDAADPFGGASDANPFGN